MAAEDVEFVSDGRTVWINNALGYCLGRFGLMGIDVHVPPRDDQRRECAYCTHKPTTEADWHVFVEKMREVHGVRVPAEHQPQRRKA